jgi:hypothetical protein
LDDAAEVDTVGEHMLRTIDASYCPPPTPRPRHLT